jgi:hypothetical protein
MSKEEISDLKEIKECLIGTEFDRKKGLVSKFDDHVNCTDGRLCKIENRISNLEKRRTFVGAIKGFLLLFAK